MAINQVQNTTTQPQKKTGGALKATASAFVPGLGEFIDGRSKAGLFFLGSRVGVNIAYNVLNNSIRKDIISSSKKENTILKIGSFKKIASVTLSLASLTLLLANIIDAYKGNKTENKKKLDIQN